MRTRAAGRIARHYLEMVLAMLVGMMLLYPGWMLATSGAGTSSVLRSTEVESLVMATTMAVPMAAWMRFRGHAWAPTLEMNAAMYAGFVVLFPVLWVGGLSADGVLVLGHVLMFAFMLVAMVFRSTEHARGRGPGVADEGRATIAAS